MRRNKKCYKAITGCQSNNVWCSRFSALLTNVFTVQHPLTCQSWYSPMSHQEVCILSTCSFWTNHPPEQNRMVTGLLQQLHLSGGMTYPEISENVPSKDLLIQHCSYLNFYIYIVFNSFITLKFISNSFFTIFFFWSWKALLSRTECWRLAHYKWINIIIIK